MYKEKFLVATLKDENNRSTFVDPAFVDFPCSSVDASAQKAQYLRNKARRKKRKPQTYFEHLATFDIKVSRIQSVSAQVDIVVGLPSTEQEVIAGSPSTAGLPTIAQVDIAGDLTSTEQENIAGLPPIAVVDITGDLPSTEPENVAGLLSIALADTIEPSSTTLVDTFVELHYL